MTDPHPPAQDHQPVDGEVRNAGLNAKLPDHFQCGEQIDFQSSVYRCGDCSMPFHQRCLKPHFEHRSRRSPPPVSSETDGGEGA